MRKIISVLFFICIGVVLLSGGTIQNIKIGYEGTHEGPFPATTVFKGDTTIIRWDASGVTGNVRIELRHQNHLLAQVIAAQYPVGDIPKSYQVSQQLVPGMYYIRVMQGSVSEDSYLFRIGPVRSIGWVNVFLEGLPDPHCFRTGQTIAVSWDQSNICGLVNVILKSVSNPAQQTVISQNRPFDDIPATYLIPNSTQVGDYVVEVRQSSVVGTSDPLEVCTAPLPLPDFKIKDVKWSFPKIPPSPYYMTIKGKVVNKNTGKHMARTSPPVKLIVRTKDGRDVWTNTKTFRKLAKFPVSFTFQVPRSVRDRIGKARSFNILLEVDPLGNVRESNEHNNKFEQSVKKPFPPVKKAVMKPRLK